MTAFERNELLYVLIQDYLIEKNINEVFQRENAESYTYAKGKLIGACMAFGLELEVMKDRLTIFAKNKKIIVINVEVSD